MYQPPTTLDERALYRRSTFQVALLTFLTSGLYLFWWSYYIRRSAAALLEERDSPAWRSVCLLVPIVNLFLIYELFERIKIASLRAGLQPPQAFPAWGMIALIALVFCGEMPVPYGSIVMLYFLPYALAIILGVAWHALLMFVYTFDTRSADFRFLPNAWLGWAVLLACLAALVQFHRQSHRLVEQSFQSA